MFELIGKYAKAVILTDNIEQGAISQIYNFLNSKAAENSKIAVMPDVHQGVGCVIGFTQAIVDKVVPNLVGVDIGCGMLVLKIDKKYGKELFNKPGLEKLDKVIRQHIPMGMNHRNKKHKYAEKAEEALKHIKCLNFLSEDSEESTN